MVQSQMPLKANTEILTEIYRRATLIRQADERFRALISQGAMAMVFYPVRGQEVLSAAAMTALNPDDYLCTIYRGLHDQIAKGVPLNELWAEFAGRETGTCKGKGGPMHITHPATGVMVTTGVVGSGMPIATGLGLSSQIRGDGRVTITCFGDGASNIGAFHESLNLASVWKLPVIFLCQNNLYAEHTALSIGTAGEIVDRALGYGMAGVRVNGNDATEMYEAVAQAAARARAGEGPTLIEARTFRFHGHLLGDTSHYIPKAEMEAAIAADPVPRLRQQLLDQQVGEAQIAGIEASAKGQIDEAVQFALDSPYADASEIRIDVFKTEIPA